MTYTTGIPQDGQSLGNSKLPIRANFDYLNTFLNVNHVAVNSLTNPGMHKWVQFPEQGSTPASGAAIGTLYSKTFASQPYTNLIWRQETGGSDPLRDQGAQIQMTNIAPSNASTGRSFLPGGILMFWGICTSAATGSISPISNPVTYTQSGEGFTLAGVASNPWVVMLTPQTSSVGPSQSFSATNIGLTSFDLRTTAYNGQSFAYLIIGPKT